MPIYQIDGLTPVVPEESFVHPTAVLIGDVILGKGVYVGPNASLRGDFGRIVVKDGANIQDNCVMHGFPEQDTVVGEDGHIGHSAILHGCIIRRNALVGMNAVVMDGAVIGENSIVGASAFVKAKAEMPANYLIVGSPAKAIRELSEQELAWKKQGTHEYQVLVTRCKQTLHQVEPLREIEPGRKRLVFDENLRAALWYDEIRCATFKGFERFFIKMIVVRMRNKHDVNPREVLLFVGFVRLERAIDKPHGRGVGGKKRIDENMQPIMHHIERGMP